MEFGNVLEAFGSLKENIQVLVMVGDVVMKLPSLEQ